MDGRAVRQGNANTIDPMRRAKATNHAQVVISKACNRGHAYLHNNKSLRERN